MSRYVHAKNEVRHQEQLNLISRNPPVKQASQVCRQRTSGQSLEVVDAGILEFLMKACCRH